MNTILLVSCRPDDWLGFKHALNNETGATIHTVPSGAEAIAAARTKHPLAVIIDQNIEDMPGFELVHQLMAISAMINVVCVSDLKAEAFHEKTEGLGIMMQLSPHPDATAARQLVQRLNQITGAI